MGREGRREERRGDWQMGRGEREGDGKGGEGRGGGGSMLKPFGWATFVTIVYMD